MTVQETADSLIAKFGYVSEDVVDVILAIPEHRNETYEIMTGNTHTKFIQAMSTHEHKYWQQVKEIIKQKLWE